MDRDIISTSASMHEWFQSPAGHYVGQWESTQFAEQIADIFGFHAVQLGGLWLDCLANNRIPYHWRLSESPAVLTNQLAPELLCDFSALPFAERSIDVIASPHALEISHDPHACLREMHRVLMPEGKLLISGFNPMSLWGLRQKRSHLLHRLGLGELFLPRAGSFLAYWRLRDWLRLLGFEVEYSQFGCYRPSFQNPKRLARSAWMDEVGERAWPIFGAVYFIVATKKVHGMHLLEPSWKKQAVRSSSPAPQVAGNIQGKNLEREVFKQTTSL